MADEDVKRVEQLLAGDERAFREFFDEYFDRLYRFAMWRTRGNVDLSEEAAQRTLCRAVRKLDSFRGEASLFTWLSRICRNELAELWEVAARDAARTVSIDSSEHVRAQAENVTATHDVDPHLEHAAADTARILRDVLHELPGRYGEVLEWKYLDELDVEEIARRLRTTFAAAQSTLQRARVALRTALEARGLDQETLRS